MPAPSVTFRRCECTRTARISWPDFLGERLGIPRQHVAEALPDHDGVVGDPLQRPASEQGLYRQWNRIGTLEAQDRLHQIGVVTIHRIVTLLQAVGEP